MQYADTKAQAQIGTQWNPHPSDVEPSQNVFSQVVQITEMIEEFAKRCDALSFRFAGPYPPSPNLKEVGLADKDNSVIGEMRAQTMRIRDALAICSLALNAIERELP